MPIATLSSASIRYEISGRGDPTVMIHGSLADRGSWEQVRVGLAPSLRTLAYDRRGHGESTGPVRLRPVHDDASDLAELLDAIDLFPVHVIAHSYGAAIALRLAADRPEMVRSLYLHEPPFVRLLEEDPATAPEADRLSAETKAIQSLVRAGKIEAAAREIADALSSEAGTWDRLRSEVRQSVLGYMVRWAEELDDPEATRPDPAVLSELLIPVLLTTGERSPPFLHRITDLLGDRLKNAIVRTLPGVGHVPHLSDPDLFIATVQGFLVERNVPST
jgi:pimeloyl-ACP methyl ester carboxylesterase